jgi:hypothetical protein
MGSSEIWKRNKCLADFIQVKFYHVMLIAFTNIGLLHKDFVFRNCPLHISGAKPIILTQIIMVFFSPSLFCTSLFPLRLYPFSSSTHQFPFQSRVRYSQFFTCLGISYPVVFNSLKYIYFHCFSVWGRASNNLRCVGKEQMPRRSITTVKVTDIEPTLSKRYHSVELSHITVRN